MNKKLKIILITFSIILFLSLIFLVGKTYSYFLTQYRNIEDKTTLAGEAGEMIIYYDGGPSIVVSQIMPSSLPFASKEFTVTGTTNLNVDLNYHLALEKPVNELANYSLSYKLTSTNTSSNGQTVPSSPKAMCYIKGNTEDEIIGNGSFNGITTNSVHSYKIDFFYPEDDPNNLGKDFNFKISVRSGEEEASSCN